MPTETLALPRITAEWLEEHDACGDAITFNERWPEGAEITAENLREAARLQLNIDWAAKYLLTDDQFYVFRDKAKGFNFNRPATSGWQDDCDALIAVLGLSDTEAQNA